MIDISIPLQQLEELKVVLCNRIDAVITELDTLAVKEPNSVLHVSGGCRSGNCRPPAGLKRSGRNFVPRTSTLTSMMRNGRRFTIQTPQPRPRRS